MSDIKVSVIVPFYNAEPYLDACIQSILSQSFTSLELLLVNDGSTDNGVDICKKYEMDSRVRIIEQKNQGGAAAKNTGLSCARGEYVGFVDADDTIDSNYLENLYYGAKEKNVDICIGNIAFTTKNGEKVTSRRTVKLQEGYFTLKEFMAFYPQYMPNAIIGAPWNKLYKMSIIKEYTLSFDTQQKNNEDTHFNYLYLAKCKTVYVSKEPFYNYMNYVGVASASKKYIPNLFDVYVSTYHKAIAFLKNTDTYEELIFFQKQYFINLIIGLFHQITSGNKALTQKERIQKIKQICSSDIVVDAAHSIFYNDKKRQFFLILIKLKQASLIYSMIKLKSLFT